MLTNNSMKILMTILCVIVKETTAVLAVSCNQPKFCPSATWNSNATTFETNEIVGNHSYSVFVDTNDTVYFTNFQKNQILQRLKNSINSTLIVFENLSKPASIFVTTNGDIYFDNGKPNNRVEKRMSNTNISIPVMHVNSSCYGLFVDTNDTIYCSIYSNHHVVKKRLDNNTMTWTRAAGTGTLGSASNMLHKPFGIFVHINFDLYVADYGNNRIQQFRSDQLNGITVAGNGSSNLTITLNHPSGIVLDADGYLFIVDQWNHRIVGSGLTGFQCLVGCSGSPGFAFNQLYYPVTLSFDSSGNMFVTDSENNRIQKFLLSTNSCGETTTSEAITTSIKTLTSSAATETSNIKSNDTTKLYGEDRTSIALSSTTTKIISVQTKETIEMATFRTSSIEIIEETTARILETATTLAGTTMATRTALVTSTNKSPSNSTVSSPCKDLTLISTFCSFFNSMCDMLEPCQNNGICQNNETEPHGYICVCPSDFNGSRCQLDQRPCKPDTCWNSGTCVDLQNKTFLCQCEEGWKGTHCEIMINYCDNITCLNNGICHRLFRSYKCECLGDSFSGEHCEITAMKIQMYRIASKSFAYIGIIAMIIVAIFIVIMDILKYCFGIDPVHKERERLRRKKQTKKRKPVIQRFAYVRAPSPSPTKQLASTTEETVV